MVSSETSVPVPSTWPCTTWPSNRPLARMGSSRFTSAPGLRRENEVLAQVSWARSAVKESPVRSTAVRQTPLTAMLSPGLSWGSSFEQETINRRVSPVAVLAATRPTSSMIPVNILKFVSRQSANPGERNRRYTRALVAMNLLIQIRIAQIPFYGKVLSETMQPQPAQACRLADASKACACGERDRAGASQDLRSIIEENLVSDTRGQRRPIHQRPAFDHNAGDFALRQSLTDRLQVRTAICPRRGNLLHL